MALIVDPDDLNQGTEVTFSTAGKTITLNQAGNLSTDGVTLKALYSFCKEEWKNDAALIPFEFPFVPITDESFELVSGWDFADDASRYLIRSSGWAVKNTSGATTQEWAGIIGLGSIEANDQLYYEHQAGQADFQLTGQVNQAVPTLSDPNGDGNFADGFDYRTQFAIFVREQAQTYDRSDIGSIGVSSLGPIAYRFPIGTGSDLKITASDNTIDTTTPYTDATNQFSATDISFTAPDTITTAGAVDFSGLTAGDKIIVTSTSGLNDGTYEVNTATSTTITVLPSGDISTETAGAAGTVGVIQTLMSITYYASPQARTIGGSSYNFGVIVDAAGGTAEQVYEFVQRQLRRSSDINASPTTGVINGSVADSLLQFVGNDLETLNVTNSAGGGTGVYIDNFQQADTNRISFRDNTEPTTPVSFPFVAVTTLSFNANLENDTDAIYRVFYTTNPAGNYGTSNAVLVHTNDEVEDTANDIGFTAPDLITSTTTTFTDYFAVGDYIHVVTTEGSNDGYYEVATISANQIELVEQTIVTQTPATAGATVTLSQTAMGKVSGNASIQFDFDYDGNTQGGRTSSSDANITVVAIGLSTGQFVTATGTIAESTQNAVSLVAPLERNYDNPV